MTTHAKATSDADHDAVLDGYEEWLNQLLFEGKGEGDVVVWIGQGRWAVLSVEGPDIFRVEIKRARLEVRDDNAR